MMVENETSADPGLQLKKRARRRLVGAAALALLAVIVLPMVMDHEPRPPVQDIQIRIPSQDSEEFAAPMPAPKLAVPKPASLPLLEPKAAPAAVPSAPTSDDNNASTKIAVTPPAPLPKPAVTPAAVEPAAETVQQQWVVQLGAYKDAANVKHLLAKLKEMNLPAYTEKIDADQGSRTRVKAGPFASREAAEKAQARIKKIGVNGTVAVK